MSDQGMRVLYVDDDDDIREIVKLSLGLDSAIDLRVCSSGPAALDMLDTDSWMPDVALLDVMMPQMDGRELMKRLRERSSFAGVPFVLITARARAADIEQYKREGATAVILKPFDPIGLSVEIRAIAGR